MQAIVVKEHGDLGVLVMQAVPDPQPHAGQVVIRVMACGVNHLDVWVRKGVAGHTFPLPLIPGNDIAGVVHAVGEGVTHVKPGDRVVVAPGTSCGHCVMCLSGRDHHCANYAILGEHRNGGYAELVAVPAVNAIPLPNTLSFVQAAAVGVAYLTAWHMLVSRAQLIPGETLLIQAAGSGVGSAAIQIGKLWGAQVIATASTDEKLQRATTLGANHTINYSTHEVHKEVKRLTGGKGCNVVFEHVGPATWQSSVRSLAWHGRLVTCGATTGAEATLNLRHLFFKGQSILGSTMGSKGDFITVLGHVTRGALQPVVDRVLPLSQAQEAHRLLEAREVFGKIVLSQESNA